ncbi:DUF418 domain-containing protein [Nesterenkonia muleiensis]|uniref:DUF418 domain-containing protein n=1 Tax=Nesterenkonia muleiensis TaxID=2282648 RepID=UPI000E71B691|nr:DUF418 domain-containing protein [Nesterenkonia muleiensis]
MSAEHGAQSTQTSAIPQRLHAVDALRALALLGILSVNIWFFAHPEMLLGVRGSAPESSADQLVRFASSLIFEGKSYVVFSFLFGLSFVLAWARAYETGTSETRRSARRCTALMVLGVLHGLFLFAGDILLAYGILGFILLGLRRILAKAALITAAVLYVAVVGLLLLVGLVSMSMEDSMGEMTEWIGDPEQAVQAYTGTVGEWFGFQAGVYPMVAFSLLLGQGPLALAAFLVGLVVGRARMLERIAAGEFSTARLLAIGVPALLLGLAVSALAAVLVWGAPGSTRDTTGYGSDLLGTVLNLAAGPVQACGYVILLLLIFRSTAPLTKALAPAGRMSLTNYLGQSVVMVIIFAGIGFGLGGQLSEVTVGAVVLGIWVVQLLVSHLWFTRFRRGPLEAPFRAWTYAGR